MAGDTRERAVGVMENFPRSPTDSSLKLWTSAADNSPFSFLWASLLDFTAICVLCPLSLSLVFSLL